jgi:hypothetical protein
MGVSGQCHAPATLYPGKGLRYPAVRKLGGSQSWSRQRLEEKSFSSAGDRTPVLQSSQTLY